MKKIILAVLISFALPVISQTVIWDAAFEIGTGANQDMYVIRQMPDGKILIAGQLTEYDGQPVNGVAKLNEDGTLDTAWVAADAGNQYGDALIEPDGKIVLGGLFGGLTRLNADGTLDTGFSAPYNFGYDVSFISKQGDKYIVSGVFNIYAGEGFYRNIMRLNYDGSIDTTFAPVQLYGSYARAYVLGDKIFITGNIEYYNETPIGNVFMLNADGSLDTSFTPLQASGNGGTVRCMAIQPDGKYVISGTFFSINGEDRNMVARLNADGTLDDSFIPPAGDGIQGTSIAIQPDGKIIVGGWFFDSYVDLDAEFDDSIVIYIERFNADGTIDTTFDTGSNFNNPVNEVYLQDDGKILAAGWFTQFDDEEKSRVARLANAPLATQAVQLASVSVYPNPVNDYLTIYLNPVNSVTAVIELYDITGKNLYTAEYTANENRQLDMSGFQSGIYFLKVADGNTITTRKIVKE